MSKSAYLYSQKNIKQNTQHKSRIKRFNCINVDFTKQLFLQRAKNQKGGQMAQLLLLFEKKITSELHKATFKPSSIIHFKDSFLNIMCSNNA